jgi:phosphate transport system permease protein
MSDARAVGGRSGFKSAQPLLDDARVRRRKRAETRFRAYGLAAIVISIAFLVVLFVTIIGNGYTAFQQTKLRLDVSFDQQVIDPSGEADPQKLAMANYDQLVKEALWRELGIDPADRATASQALGLVSTGAGLSLRSMVLADPSIIGKTATVWVPAHSDVDMTIKGQMPRDVPENRRRLNDQQLAWMDQLAAGGLVEKQFNDALFTSGASASPELAGVGVAVVGSLYMMLITLALALPTGVAAAIYLEEFAPKNRFTDLIEVNINNLAAVPSIVFGILGLAIFIQFLGLPRSAPIVGGLVLALMTLPTVIIATRAALRAVPPSIREAALGVGASKMQAIFHHVLPLAAPGVLTGTIIGMARALGETAPLLMIGMVAFAADYPASPLSPSTGLPVQIYMWATLPERGFVERTSAAIIVLLVFMLLMNATAVFLRKRFERRW